MKLRLLSLTLLVALLGAFVAMPRSAAAQTETPSASIPINFSSALGSFQGTLNIERFRVQQGQLAAVGTVTGTVRNALGAVVGTVTNLPVTLPVIGQQQDEACTILTLDLGPLDLNILGLHIHLDEVHLVIEAHPGEGLLGDLLCELAGLLDRPGNRFGQLVRLLNQILGQLG